MAAGAVTYSARPASRTSAGSTATRASTLAAVCPCTTPAKRRERLAGRFHPVCDACFAEPVFPQAVGVARSFTTLFAALRTECRRWQQRGLVGKCQRLALAFARAHAAPASLSAVVGPADWERINFAPDSDGPRECRRCGRVLGLLDRRRHCRLCGAVHCSGCVAPRLRVRPSASHHVSLQCSCSCKTARARLNSTIQGRASAPPWSLAASAAWTSWARRSRGTSTCMRCGAVDLYVGISR